MKLIKTKFAGAKIQPQLDEGVPYSILAKVEFWRELENLFTEVITVEVFLFGSDLSVKEIERQSIERANEFIKSVASAY